MTKKHRLSTNKKVSFSFAILILCLVFLESAVRVRAQLRYGSGIPNATDQRLKLDPRFGMKIPIPGSSWNGAKSSGTINSLGFRGKECTTEKPDGVFRIVCLGASTTYCAELSGDDFTWPAQLEKDLNEHYGNRVEVINAGIGGCRIEHSKINLTERVLPLDPDLLILYHANNDIVADTRQVAIEEGAFTNHRQSWLAWMGRYSLFASLLHKNLLINKAGEGSPKIPQLPAGYNIEFKQRLSEICDIANHERIPIVLSSFLVKFRKDQEQETQRKNADVAFFHMPWMTLDLLYEAFDDYNAIIAEVSEESACYLIDENTSIPGDTTHFIDCMHFTDEGAKKMAQRFSHFLIENELIAKSSNTAADQALPE